MVCVSVNADSAIPATERHFHGKRKADES